MATQTRWDQAGAKWDAAGLKWDVLAAAQLSGALVGTGVLSGALQTGVPDLVANLIGTGVLGGSLQVGILLSGALVGIGVLNGSLQVGILLAANLHGTGTLAGDLQALGPLFPGQPTRRRHWAFQRQPIGPTHVVVM